MTPRPFRWLALCVAAALPLWALAPEAALSQAGTTLPDVPGEDPEGARVIVKYKALGSLMRNLRATASTGTPARGPQYAATLGQRHGLALRDGRIIEGRSQVVRGDKSLNSATLAARLAADPEVEYAVPDQWRHAMVLPDDPLLNANASNSPAAGQWYLRAPDSSFVSAINATGAWGSSTGSAAVVVADIDTGVLLTHPDLVNKVFAGYDFVSSSSTAGDGNGRDADATDPGDWATAGQCSSGSAASNSSWHGTQTSSLIGAQTGNGTGMASVGYQAMVLPVRVLGKCGGTDSDIIAGMLWAAGLSSNPTTNPNPARILNLSLGGSGTCSAAYADAMGRLTAAGVVVVAAAGNDEGLAVSTPANCSGAIAVAGVRHTGTKVGYSNVGAQVAIAAPAGNCVNLIGACLYPIITATNTGTSTAVAHSYSNSTRYAVGTSFATPLVAGTAALILSANPALTPAQVKGLLQGSARPFPASSVDPTVPMCHAPNGVAQDECLCTTSTCGAGLLDASAAVAAAVASAAPTALINASASTVTYGTQVSFDGSASTAPGGQTITGHGWAITTGSGAATWASATSGPTASVNTVGLGSFTVMLTVTDSLGRQASASRSVMVNAPAAPVPQLLASAGVVPAGQSISLDASGSTAAAGVTVAGYQWALLSGAAIAGFEGTTDAATATLATQGAGSGSLSVRLTVTDSLGQQASTTQSFSVTPVVPTAAISSGTGSVAVGSSLVLDGSGSSAVTGRSVAGYQWAITSGHTVASFSGASNAATATLKGLATGSVTLQLTVTDSAGAQDSRSTVVSVMPAPTGAGGGASAPAWVLGVLAAALALRRTHQQRQAPRQGPGRESDTNPQD